MGRQIVAVSHNREISTALGINVKRISLLTFVVGSILGALSWRVSFAHSVSWVPGIGGEMIVLSFAVVATAGLGQIEGALVAAMLIGLARSFTVYLLPGTRSLNSFPDHGAGIAVQAAGSVFCRAVKESVMNRAKIVVILLALVSFAAARCSAMD
jgi:branched-subunit amino acid ABC-type transport system permease component